MRETDVGTASPDPETGDRLITAGTRAIFSVGAKFHGLAKFKSLPRWLWSGVLVSSLDP